MVIFFSLWLLTFQLYTLHATEYDFQYGGTVNQNKEDNSIHQKNLAKLCRICCNMVEKKKYQVKKYTDSIENHFYININIDNNAIHPEYVPKMLFINDQFNETKNYYKA